MTRKCDPVRKSYTPMKTKTLRNALCHRLGVVLDLSTTEDRDGRIAREPDSERLLRKSLRLCRQAYRQGGLLSNCDLAELLAFNEARLARLLTEHERQTEQLVPRRATVHDMGSGVSHKRLICRKRYLDGKPPEQVARETYHTLEAVDRYLGQYERVRACRKEGMEPERIAYTLNCSLRLVNEYLQLDQELDSAPLGPAAGASPQTGDGKE